MIGITPEERFFLIVLVQEEIKRIDNEIGRYPLIFLPEYYSTRRKELITLSKKIKYL